MYDPMVAKLIVWDADREQATRRMLRALGEYEIEGLKTLIPFHQALLATEQWARGETCRDLLEDKAWLKTLAFPAPAAPGRGGRGARDGRADIRGRGLRQALRRARRRTRRSPAAPARRGGERRGGRRPRGAQARAARAASSSAGGPDTLPSPLQGNMWKVLVKQGDTVEEGQLLVHHRGDEDGERDHRPQGGHDRRAADRGGRADPGRRADRDDQRPPQAESGAGASGRCGPVAAGGQLHTAEVLDVQAALLARAAPRRQRHPAPRVRARRGRRDPPPGPLSARSLSSTGPWPGTTCSARPTRRRRRSSVCQIGLDRAALADVGISIRRQVVAGDQHARPGRRRSPSRPAVWPVGRVQLELLRRRCPQTAGHGQRLHRAERERPGALDQ